MAFSLLSACADTRGGPIPYDQPFAAPDAPSLATLASDYKIAPMDKISVTNVPKTRMTVVIASDCAV